MSKSTSMAPDTGEPCPGRRRASSRAPFSPTALALRSTATVPTVRGRRVGARRGELERERAESDLPGEAGGGRGVTRRRAEAPAGRDSQPLRARAGGPGPPHHLSQREHRESPALTGCASHSTVCAMVDADAFAKLEL